MSDVKKMLNDAVEELKKEQDSSINKVIRELIDIERKNYYSSRGISGRLKEIKTVINKYSRLGDEDVNPPD